jgi:exopolysaccharide biosynthesis protein
MYKQVICAALLFMLGMQQSVKAQYNPQTEIGRLLLDHTPVISKLIADTSFTIGKEVQETDLQYLNRKGQPMHVFILRANLRSKKLRLQLLTAGSTSKGRETLSNMIRKSMDSGKIIAGVNADFFNLETGIPMGILYKDGVALKDSFSTGKQQQGLSWLGIQKKKRQVVIGSKDSTRPVLQDAAGGGVTLVKNYVVVPQTIRAIHPRTAVGITGKQEALFVVVDGRNAAYSNGIDYTELSLLLQALGAKDAINLDGGGSSTFIIRNPNSHQLEVRNKPSDGSERPLSNAWIITTR